MSCYFSVFWIKKRNLTLLTRLISTTKYFSPVQRLQNYLTKPCKKFWSCQKKKLIAKITAKFPYSFIYILYSVSLMCVSGFTRKSLTPFKRNSAFDFAIFEKKKNNIKLLKERFISGTSNSRKRFTVRKCHSLNRNVFKTEHMLSNFKCWFSYCVYFLKIPCWVCCTLFRLFSIRYILIALIVTQQLDSVHHCLSRQTKLELVLYGDQKRLLTKKIKSAWL